MKIELITKEQHNQLLEIFKNNPMLTLQNVGYEYINKSKLTQEEWKQIDVIEQILKKAIHGFSSFSNFRITDITKDIRIRMQYNYNYDGKGLPFIGVGYIRLDDLLNGFD